MIGSKPPPVDLKPDIGRCFAAAAAHRTPETAIQSTERLAWRGEPANNVQMLASVGETIAVFLLVGGAGAYLALALRRRLKGHQGGLGCCGRGLCGARDRRPDDLAGSGALPIVPREHLVARAARLANSRTAWTSSASDVAKPS